MKNSSSSSSSSKGAVVAENNNGNSEEIDWELRPGGMLVQKREDEVGDSGVPLIKVKVSHGTSLHEVNVPAQATFGDLKRLVARETGFEPKDQRLLFRGKEREDEECLHMVGVKNMSKVVLMEDPASKERKVEEMKRKLEDMKKNQGISKACEAINRIRAEVDKLAQKVSVLESTVHGGTKVDEKEFVVLTELLMVQLLKLDGIDAEGEAKLQRRAEVRRVQSYVDLLDTLKARNTNPFVGRDNTVAVTTKWETFESGVGSLSAPPPTSSPTVTQDWEVFN